VIGGLIGATIATLLILPALFAIVQRETTRKSPSLDPADPTSPYFRQRPPAGPNDNGRSKDEEPDVRQAPLPEARP